MRKKSKSLLQSIRGWLALLIAVVLVMTGCAQADEPQTEPTAQTEASESRNAETEPSDAQPEEAMFPFELENGAIRVISLFQFSGFNPDCGGEEGEDIAALQIENVSQEHLAQADIAMTMPDGQTLNFSVTDLPAGASAMAFSLENAAVDQTAVFDSVSCTAEFAEESPLMADRLECQVEGMQITVTNVSGEDITNLNVYCHSILQEQSFGGLTYCYTVSELPAGESTVLEAYDCYLDGAQVVRVECDDQP